MKRGRPRGSAQPGVKRKPLTQRELDILQMISEGFSPRELAGNGSAQAIRRSLYLIRIKLDAFTNPHACMVAYKQNLIKGP